ncbi:M20 family peptidase [Cryobacterium melibiosiphilum]|uniref:Peptidase M20 domain-containing protein 2 n=1 Tax=Cryobacterium melibiosiphilum TaxID=995039 RepID=A0A3A5MHY1_9MICO|nr:M20 family metallopeptidase [Cryobacterium melibiosiphilum]RJT85722.1 M20 family peptidase [Cryobacterium melibiosiphilum]
MNDAAPAIESLSRDLHAHPETSFREFTSAAKISAFLAAAGFTLAEPLTGSPTAFVAVAGSGPLVVGICVEYDALPEIGHACGHNLITGASLAAATSLVPFVDELGITLKVIGTPAEEHGGGKVYLLEQGIFDDVALAMMVHPVSEGLSVNPAGTSSQVVGRYRVTFHGKASHAAAAPHLGINAADAAVVSQVAIGLLRQQLPSDHRVALFVAEAGVVTNIIPDTAVVNYECRAFTREQFDSLQARVRRCFDAGALATGATVDYVDVGPVYEALVQDDVLSSHWCSAMEFLGRDVSRSPGLSGGSTDMGNVSQLVPSIHPWVGIPGATSPIHSAGFADTANTAGAYTTMFESALGMAWTIADVAQDPSDRQEFLTRAHDRCPAPLVAAQKGL